MTTPWYMLDYHVAAMWPPRGETREQCAERALKWLALMRQCDPNFAKWFLQVEDLAEAHQYPVGPDPAVFASRWEESRVLGHRRLSQSVWNGLAGEEGCSAVFFVGDTNPEHDESVSFDVPLKGPFADRIVTAAGLSAILRAMALAWDPEEGIAYTMQLLDAAFEGRPHKDPVGWVSYYARSRGPIPPLPPPVRTESVEDKGTLVILGDEKLSGSNPAHVALAQQVSAELKRAGVRKPLQPDVPQPPAP